MRSIASLSTTVVGLMFANTAWGQCATSYTTDSLLQDMIMVEEGLRSDNAAVVSDAGGRLEKGIGCLNEVLPQMMVGRTYRAIAAGKLLAEDEGGARSWYATAVEVDSTFDYGLEDLPAEHPVRNVYNDLKIAYVPPAETVEGMVLTEGPAHYLDGRKISAPEAVQARPHLYQRVDGGSTFSAVIKGNKFPDDAIVDPAAMAEAGGKDKKKKKKDKDPGVTINSDGFVQRARPPEKTPLIIGGIVTILGAGGIYGYTFKTNSDFDACEDPDCINQTRDLTNRLILVSAGVLALGTATFTWGAMVDANGNPIGPSVHMKW